MRRILLAGLLAIALAAPAIGDDLPEPFVKLDYAGGNGSAFHIGGGRFLTAAHIAEKGNIVLSAQDGTTRPADVVWIDTVIDVALLSSDGGWVADVALLCDIAPRGSPITAHGNPLGLDFLEFRGHVAGTPAPNGVFQDRLPLDITILEGASGGAVTDDSGRVVGMAISIVAVNTVPAAAKTVTGLGLAVPGSVLCDLLGLD